MKVVASAIVDKYIGESARVIREMFGTLQAMGAEEGGACRVCEGAPTVYCLYR